jgi:dTDP-4-dehydrorhamnose reductase
VYAARSSMDTFEVIQGNRNVNHEAGTVEIDITDASSVDLAFRKVQPDYVLLLAAISDIDRCEASPTDAFAINARGAEHVANACARANTRLLFTSTAAIFDGRKHGYREEDEANPLSVYGQTKAWAEYAVKSLTPGAVVLRFALAIGFARSPATNAILDKLLRAWKAGTAVSFPTREIRNPIDADSLAKIMLGLLANQKISGVYHVGASDSLTRYELGQRLAIRAGVSADLVRPQVDPPPGRAPRGEDHFLLTEKIRRVSDFPVESCDQVIERCFS